MGRQSGQLLVEVLIAVLAIVAIAALGAQFILVGQKSNQTTGDKDTALKLVAEAFSAVRGISTENWQAIYGLSKGSSNLYHPEDLSGKWVLVSGSLVVTINGINYTRSLYIDNVSRDTSNNIVLTGGTDDPSTQKVTVNVSWPNAATVSGSEYVTRWRSKSCVQTDWSGGAGGSTATCPTTRYDTGDGNIDNTGGSIKFQ